MSLPFWEVTTAMQFKLAFKNVRKSFKDYTIYFLTIAFGVCLFYVFNSLDSQSTMDILSDDQRNYYKLLTQMINGVSIFVSVILAFLILYANKFLIKRRKKELSVYMILGMDKSKISATLVVETLFTGLLALGVGLVVGIFASQALSVVVANMFKAEMSQFHFTFSVSALLKTIVYFGLIFILVMIFNIINVTKCKLITLIQSQSRNESGKIRNLPLSILIFVVAVALLVFAYHKILVNNFMGPDKDFWTAIICGAIGTFLFFFSLSGFLYVLIKKNKKLYYRHLNIFTFRQLTNKINTNCISMTLICLMLLMTIGVLACANGVNDAMSKTLEEANPQDATFSSSHMTIGEGDTDGEIIYSIENPDEKLSADELYKDERLDKIAKSKEIVSLYLSGISVNDYAPNIDKSNYADGYIRSTAISISDYNKVLKMRGEKEMTLGKDEYAVINNASSTAELFDKDNMPDIEINGKKLSYKGGDLLTTQIDNLPALMTVGVLVVNDEDLSAENLYSRDVLVNYFNENDDKAFIELCNEYKLNEHTTSYSQESTRKQCFDATTGVSVIATFVSLYIGIIFLITSCAVLALQQLSESTDNADRYKLIRKLGASSKDINKALFRQILTYFAMPLVLAVVHSVVGIKAATNLIEQIGQMNILSVSAITAAIIIVVYGGYFMVTYFCSKNIIKNAA